MELIEKMGAAIRDTDDCGKDLAHQYAQAALTAMLEHAGGDGVTAADREAAAEFAAQTSGAAITDPQIQACISGKMDDSLVVWHFAHHRATAFAAGRAAREREIVEWLRGDSPEHPGDIADAIERGEV